MTTKRVNGDPLARQRGDMREIRRLIARIRIGSSPRRSLAMWCALTAFAGVLVAEALLPGRGSRIFWASAPAVSALASYWLAMKMSKRPMTLHPLLGELLANYQPVNRTAYATLQEETREMGWLDIEPVQEWTERELSSWPRTRGPLEPGAAAFVGKLVGNVVRLFPRK